MGTFEKSLDKFKLFIDAIRGRRDVKQRVAVLADPTNLLTMSNLRPAQADFVNVAYWASDENRGWGDMWRGLRDYATLMMQTACSIRGERAEQVIRLAGALSEAKLLSKLGIDVRGEPSGKGRK